MIDVMENDGGSAAEYQPVSGREYNNSLYIGGRHSGLFPGLLVHLRNGNVLGAVLIVRTTRTLAGTMCEYKADSTSPVW